MRPVINLKALNQWVEIPHFKMEGLTTLRDLLRQGDWLVKVDLKDAYLTVPVHPDHQCYLRFSVEGVYLSPIRAGMCPVGLHQGNESCGDLAQIMGVLSQVCR